jgi:hypothetical protein
MAAFNDIDSAIKKFTNNGNPYYALFVNGVKIDTNAVYEDIDEASEKLRDDLTPYKNSKNSWDDKIVVYCFNDKNAPTKLSVNEIKNKCSAAISLRFPDVRENNSGSNVNREVIEMLTLLRNDLATQKEKLASLEAELIEDDEDDEDDENPIIGSLKRNPEVMDGVINMAAMALGKLFNTTKVSALGSIDKIENNEPIDSVSLNNSIEILSKNDPKLVEHLAYLANLSLENPTQFNFLTSMLK